MVKKIHLIKCSPAPRLRRTVRVRNDKGKVFIAFVLTFLVVFIGGTASTVYAKETPKQGADAEAEGDMRKTVESARKAEEAAEKARAAEAKAREALKSQEWTVYLTTEDGRGTEEAEVIVFTPEDKVSLKNLLAKGYTDSNFRLTVPDEGTIVWETMKVDQDKNLAFLRGELRGNVMKGSIFYKPRKGETETVYFTTTKPETGYAPPKKKGRNNNK